jgi:hypothetical protein
VSSAPRTPTFRAATRVMSQRRDDDPCPESVGLPSNGLVCKALSSPVAPGLPRRPLIERPVQRGGRPNYAASPQRGAHLYDQP